MNTFYCVKCGATKNFSIKYPHKMFLIRSDNKHFSLIILLIKNFYRSMTDKIYLYILLNIVLIMRAKLFTEIGFTLEKHQQISKL